MTQTIQHISETFIKPAFLSDEPRKQAFYLTPWGLSRLSMHYIEGGLLFAKPPQDQTFNILNLLEQLMHSLALTLVHFYPLAGRLITTQSENPASYKVFVGCHNSPGAKFIHAVVNLTISDILSPNYVPEMVQYFFDNCGAPNHCGHFRPLLSVQVTELVDGFFIGCSMNHCLADGTSFDHFIGSWSRVIQAQGDRISTIKQWIPYGLGPSINLPFTHHEPFVRTWQWQASAVKEKIFNISAASIQKLKEKANRDLKRNEISSLQSFSALVWRSITRARHLPDNQMVYCKLSIDNRTRLNPPLSESYLGCFVQTVEGTATAEELLKQNLGYAAWKLHQAVNEHTSEKIQSWIQSWIQAPQIQYLGDFNDHYGLRVVSSPRFSSGKIEFGLGEVKALALLSGCGNKHEGAAYAYPGTERGSVALDVCLAEETMEALESDEEFIACVSSIHHGNLSITSKM